MDQNELILSDFFDRYITPLVAEREKMDDMSMKMWRERIDGTELKPEKEIEKFLEEKTKILRLRIHKLYDEWWDLHDKHKI